MTFTFHPSQFPRISRRQILSASGAIASLSLSLLWWMPVQARFQPFTSQLTAPPVRVKSTKSQAPARKPSAQKPALKTAPNIFKGGANSIVSKTVGSAEGTRTPNGGKTRAYSGHSDPGNGVWNLGSFSYQHCSSCTPEQADELQLVRLKKQDKALQAQAKSKGIKLTIEERLNGIDLANQSPLAALDYGGYIDRLAQAKSKGMTGDRSILEARVWAYWCPSKNFWDAPGLGNNQANITHDQNRRMEMIAQAIAIARRQGLMATSGQSSKFERWIAELANR